MKRINPEKQYTVTLDDDPTVRVIIQKTLGYPSLPFTSSTGLLAQAAKLAPSAAFIDVYLGENDIGLDIVPKLRRIWPCTAIFVMTSAPDDTTIHRALSAGADDYALKPIVPSELSARFEARAAQVKERYESRGLTFLGTRLHLHELTIEGSCSHESLSPKVFNLLRCLFLANGRTVDKSSLSANVWGVTVVSSNAMDQKVLEARKALQRCAPELKIVSSYGKGWKLVRE